MFAQRQAHAQLLERFGIVTEVLQLLFIAEGHLRAHGTELPDEGLVADPRADERHFFAPQKRGQGFAVLLHFCNTAFPSQKCRRAAKTPGNGYLIHYSHFWKQAQPKQPRAGQKKRLQTPFCRGFRPAGEK